MTRFQAKAGITHKANVKSQNLRAVNPTLAISIIVRPQSKKDRYCMLDARIHTHVVIQNKMLWTSWTEIILNQTPMKPVFLPELLG